MHPKGLDQWHGLMMVARMSSSSAGGESATYFTEPPDFHISPRALHSQECFLPLRGGFNLRCTRERYIPKNVFFLREEVLIYDAPRLPRKDNRFDQELPSIRGSKVWRKGSRPVAWLDGMVEILVSVEFTTGKGRERVELGGRV